MSHPLLDHFAAQATRHTSPNLTQFSVKAGESRVLPRPARRLRVLSGKAWISLDSADHIIRYQETFQLHHDASSIIVTALGQEHLRLEIIA
jgi:hypothetical protein